LKRCILDKDIFHLDRWKEYVEGKISNEKIWYNNSWSRTSRCILCL
jgi:hypothetical protein